MTSLALVFVPGFMGTAETFGRFPEDVCTKLQQILSIRLPEHPVVLSLLVAPAFDSAELTHTEAVIGLAAWLCANARPVEFNCVAIMAHSMGGLVSADVIRLLRSLAAAHPSEQFPNIICLLTYDSPFFGVHSSNVAADVILPPIDSASTAVSKFSEPAINQMYQASRDATTHISALATSASETIKQTSAQLSQYASSTSKTVLDRSKAFVDTTVESAASAYDQIPGSPQQKALTLIAGVGVIALATYGIASVLSSRLSSPAVTSSAASLGSTAVDTSSGISAAAVEAASSISANAAANTSADAALIDSAKQTTGIEHNPVGVHAVSVNDASGGNTVNAIHAVSDGLVLGNGPPVNVGDTSLAPSSAEGLGAGDAVSQPTGVFNFENTQPMTAPHVEGTSEIFGEPSAVLKNLPAEFSGHEASLLSPTADMQTAEVTFASSVNVEGVPDAAVTQLDPAVTEFAAPTSTCATNDVASIGGLVVEADLQNGLVSSALEGEASILASRSASDGVALVEVIDMPVVSSNAAPTTLSNVMVGMGDVVANISKGEPAVVTTSEILSDTFLPVKVSVNPVGNDMVPAGATVEISNGGTEILGNLAELLPAGDVSITGGAQEAANSIFAEAALNDTSSAFGVVSDSVPADIAVVSDAVSIVGQDAVSSMSSTLLTSAATSSTASASADLAASMAVVSESAVSTLHSVRTLQTAVVEAPVAANGIAGITKGVLSVGATVPAANAGSVLLQTSHAVAAGVHQASEASTAVTEAIGTIGAATFVFQGNRSKTTDNLPSSLAALTAAALAISRAKERKHAREQTKASVVVLESDEDFELYRSSDMTTKDFEVEKDDSILDAVEVSNIALSPENLTLAGVTLLASFFTGGLLAVARPLVFGVALRQAQERSNHLGFLYPIWGESDEEASARLKFLMEAMSSKTLVFKCFYIQVPTAKVGTNNAVEQGSIMMYRTFIAQPPPEALPVFVGVPMEVSDVVQGHMHMLKATVNTTPSYDFFVQETAALLETVL
ncbi:hypothetical protein HDU84_009216, partial [Entophlyctis sp. JEL0112]